MVHVDTVSGAGAEPFDPKAERRMKERQKMQRYRQRLAAKVVYLKDLTRKMETQIRVYSLQRQASKTLLAWEHIANELREESDHTSATNASLRDQCHQQAALIRSMKQWVVQVTGSSTRIPASPTCSAKRPLQYVTMSDHPASRRLGFDWITRYLYHNCDNTFQRMGFPASDMLSEFSLDMTDPDACMYVWRSQREFPASLEYVRDVFARPNLVGQMRGTYIKKQLARPCSSIEDDMAAAISQDEEMLHDLQGMYTHSEWGPNNTVNFLARQFSEPNRCVFVAQNIHDDALFPNAGLQRNRMIWIALDRVSDDRTRVRAMCINSHGFNKDGYVSFEDEAIRWGCDVSQFPTDHQRHEHFASRVRQVAGHNGSSFGQDFYNKVNAVYGARRGVPGTHETRGVELIHK